MAQNLGSGLTVKYSERLNTIVFTMSKYTLGCTAGVGACVPEVEGQTDAVLTGASSVPSNS